MLFKQNSFILNPRQAWGLKPPLTNKVNDGFPIKNERDLFYGNAKNLDLLASVFCLKILGRIMTNYFGDEFVSFWQVIIA